MTDGHNEGQQYRTEHDSMGEVRVPAHAKWRAQTQRAVENFPVSGQRIERAHIEALARIKGAAAKVNADLGVVDKDIAGAIQEAAEEVAAGDWDAHFPVDVFQVLQFAQPGGQHVLGDAGRRAHDLAEPPMTLIDREEDLQLPLGGQRAHQMDDRRKHRMRHDRAVFQKEALPALYKIPARPGKALATTERKGSM